MYSIACLLVIIHLVSPLTIYSQVNNYSVENFFIEEGFPVTRILNINQDDKGLIWICSESGLHSFNGSNFELKLDFNKINFFPTKILFDNNGNKWLLEVSKTSTLKFNPYVKDIKIYDNQNKEINVAEYLNLSDTKINKVFQNDSGLIVFEFDSTFYSFNKEKEKISLPIGTINYVFSDKDHILTNTEKESLIIDATSLNTIFEFKGKEAFKVKKFKGIIYILFTNGEIYSFNPTTKESKLVLENILKYSDSVSGNLYEDLDFLLDDSGDVWILALRSLTLYNIKEQKEVNFNNVKKLQTLPYNTTAFKDREGNIWVGTNLGINKISRNQKAIFQNSAPFYYSTRKIHQINNEEIFVSTYSGNFIYNLKTSNYKKKTSSYRLKTNHSVIIDLLIEDDFVYSISRYKKLRKETLSSNILLGEHQFPILFRDGRYPSSLLKLKNGQKLLLNYNKIYEFDEELNYTVIVEDETKDLFINGACEIDEEIYLLTNKGITIYSSNFIKLREILPGLSINLLHQDRDDKNILWVATTSGLIKYNIQNDKGKLFGSPSDFINISFTAIKEDNNGNLWLPSFAGLNKFNKKTEKSQVYFLEEGLSNNEFNNRSSLELSDGRFVFGSISGLTFINTTNIKNEDLSFPNIQIYSCTMLTSKSAQRLELTEQVNQSSTLRFKENNIEANILLSQHSFTNLKSKIFRSRIFKKDNQGDVPWESLASNEVQLGRMPYGDYILQYQVIDKYGNKISEINQISVEYIKPIYKSLLFGLGVILLSLFCIYYFFQQRSLSLIQQKAALEAEVSLRTQQIQTQKQELENLNKTKDKLFSILAHDLKSPLITLKNISGKINYLIEKNQPYRIIEIGKTIEEKVSNLNIFLDNLLNWAIQQRGHFTYKPHNLPIQNITNEIFQLFDDLILEKELKIKQNIPIDSSCYIDENSIKTVIRNVIHNAIKYSPKGGTISINFKYNEEYSILAISDMGSGIPQATIDAIYKKQHIRNTVGTVGEKGTGLGFLISKELMDLNNGQIVFITNANQGTTVELLLPTTKT